LIIGNTFRCTQKSAILRYLMPPDAVPVLAGIGAADNISGLLCIMKWRADMSPVFPTTQIVQHSGFRLPIPTAFGLAFR
jgi:hypothetical protein